MAKLVGVPPASNEDHVAGVMLTCLAIVLLLPPNGVAWAGALPPSTLLVAQSIELVECTPDGHGIMVSMSYFTSVGCPI